jgi:3-hydroxyacyl-[acyl-carrier-protein] dehydratase
MKFGLIDRIVELNREQRIVAVKAVSLAEEYLADHFPTFPVLPGVLMLEALAEAGAWLVRDAQEFASSVILLRHAKNVTYKSFVKPGNLLRLEVTCRRLARDESDFAGTGYCGQGEVVRARFGLRHFSLADRQSGLAPVDRRIVAEARMRFANLYSQAQEPMPDVKHE